MSDTLISFLRHSLPDEIASVLQDVLQNLENGDFGAIFARPEVKVLLGHEDNAVTKDVNRNDFDTWSDYIFHRLGCLLSNRIEKQGDHTIAYRQHLFFVVAVASLYAFLQSNVTGPPLPFVPATTLLPKDVSSDATALATLREGLISSLASDGVAAYKLTPNIELLCLAETILICPPVQKNIDACTWARIRVDFMHQRLLSEVAPSLQSAIYDNLEALDKQLLSSEARHSIPDMHVHFLLERATIHTHHGFDKKAIADLDQATKERKFEYALTGLMGKRTKYQENDTSQLVVLARSAGAETSTEDTDVLKPKNLELNDDTLHEQIVYTEKLATDANGESPLPASLAALNPADQPLLDPLDSVILLSKASSVTNTNPADGITREQTLPYATRVLEGGSSNWQVYTQALLVRSRIEGYKSRTLERGLLQLQALVDQVIAETSGSAEPATVETTATNGEEQTASDGTQVTSFLPKAKEGESAPVGERLAYLFALGSPTRWELEAELAARWVSVGGLRSALEIYERLEMWAEAALCWAATDKEDKARKVIRKQLFHATSGPDDHADLDEENWEGPARDPPSTEAPRLYCILGDIDNDLTMYQRAWDVSGKRYARAQRSLGRQYFSAKDYVQAAEAYRLALKVNALNHTSWFALGCANLELQRFKDAVEAFSRCVQLDDQDAEAWSNLAAALLHLRPKVAAPTDADGNVVAEANDADEINDDSFEEKRVSSHPRQDALKAFKRAASLKHNNTRIWSNVLAVAASTTPPSWPDLLSAQRRLCELRGPIDGETCVDAEILSLLITRAMHEGATTPSGAVDVSRPGLPRLVNELVEKHIKPLITASARLWGCLAVLYVHTGRPGAALEAHEKAWRAVTSQPKWEAEGEARWNAVVGQTVGLVDAYESLGPRERTEGLAAGSGLLVARDWKFKARSAVRSVMGTGRGNWEDSEGWERLVGRLEGLK